MFNSHVHTQFSTDCQTTGEQMCDSAIKKAMGGIAFTDHCSLDSYITDNCYRNALASVRYSQELRKKYSDRLYITSGIEISEAMRKHDYAERILRAARFDIVLMSVHGVFMRNVPVYLSRIDFGVLSDDEAKKITADYFRDLKETVQHTDFDVCAHLTLPLRYTNGKYGKRIDVREYDKVIDDILSSLIAREKALELNTSELHRQIYDFMPDETILRRYRKLGGELVTLGTDAHRPENIDEGFTEGVALLRKCGFECYYRYESRKPISVSL